MDEEKTFEEKMLQSKKERTTSIVYDKAYWDNYWKKRFKVEYNENDKVVIRECEKKNNWINRLFHIDPKERPKGTLLDVGCSFGFFVSFMRKQGWDAYGIDVSAYALGIAPKHIKKFLRYGSVTDMPFADNRFGVVFCFDMLEHLYIEEIFKAVKELTRVSSRGIGIKLPVQGFDPNTERGITDWSHRSEDKTHVSIYPWEFWAKRFTESNKFRLQICSLWLGDDTGAGVGECMEAWMIFRRR